LRSAQVPRRPSGVVHESIATEGAAAGSESSAVLPGRSPAPVREPGSPHCHTRNESGSSGRPLPAETAIPTHSGPDLDAPVVRRFGAQADRLCPGECNYAVRTSRPGDRAKQMGAEGQRRVSLGRPLSAAPSARGADPVATCVDAGLPFGPRRIFRLGSPGCPFALLDPPGSSRTHCST
jgi:hypothetical protein